MTRLHCDARYTLRGGSAIEKRIGAMVTRAANAVKQNIARDDYRALLLIGGYGRGEGGVVQVEGEERPHNNLDFLLVTTPRATLRRAAMKRKLDDLFTPIVRDESIGIDTGVIGDVELRFAPARVIWFDMRWGHRTILGDGAFIPSLRPICASDIEIDDVHNLLVNRASLLVINDAIDECGNLTHLQREFIIKHLMKAIIGHGDALLFARGRYHASYAEKQKRMRELTGVVPGLASLYDEAAEFRFEPRYDRYQDQQLKDFSDQARDILASTHLEFERFRSNDAMCTFQDHQCRVLLTEDKSPRSLISGSKHLLRSLMQHPTTIGLPYQLEMAARRSHPRKLLAAALPTVLYGPTNEQDAAIVQCLLRANGKSRRALRQAYLSHWAKHGDPNFPTTAQRLGLSLEVTRKPS